MARSTSFLVTSTAALLAASTLEPTSAFHLVSRRSTVTIHASSEGNSDNMAAAPNGEESSNKEQTAEINQEDAPIYFNILTEANPPPTKQVVVSKESELSEAALAASAKVMDSYATRPSNNFEPINGWVPKEDYALWGLPGAISPLGFFDPIGFARQGTPLNDAKRLRETEIQHGRVAMLATVGYLAQEAINPIGGGPFHLSGPANDQLQQVPTIPFALLSISIAAAELYRAKKGWVEPKFKIGSNTLWTLRDNYYPGDLGFDPLGLKPTLNYDFQQMQTKELSNGRLAMLGWAGMCAQELVNHRTIGETWDFYSKLFSGEYSYY